MCVCVCVLSSHLFWTSDLWKYQPGSHRRKVSQDFSETLNKNRRFGLSRVDMMFEYECLWSRR